MKATGLDMRSSGVLVVFLTGVFLTGVFLTDVFLTDVFLVFGLERELANELESSVALTG